MRTTSISSRLTEKKRTRKPYFPHTWISLKEKTSANRPRFSGAEGNSRKFLAARSAADYQSLH